MAESKFLDAYKQHDAEVDRCSEHWRKEKVPKRYIKVDVVQKSEPFKSRIFCFGLLATIIETSIYTDGTVRVRSEHATGLGKLIAQRAKEARLFPNVTFEDDENPIPEVIEKPKKVYAIPPKAEPTYEQQLAAAKTVREAFQLRVLHALGPLSAADAAREHPGKHLWIFYVQGDVCGLCGALRLTKQTNEPCKGATRQVWKVKARAKETA